MPARKTKQRKSSPVWNVLTAQRHERLMGKHGNRTNYGVLAIDALPNHVTWVSGGFGAVQFINGVKHAEMESHVPRFVLFRDQVWSTGTEQHILCYFDDTWEAVAVPFRYAHQLHVVTPSQLVAESRDGLWLSDTGTYWERLPFPWGTTSDANCWSAGDNTLWITTNRQDQMYHYAIASAHIQTIPLPKASRESYGEKVLAGLADDHGGFWASLDGIGLCYWNGEQWERTPLAGGSLEYGLPGLVHGLCFDQNQRVWAVTQKHICQLDNQMWTPFEVEKPVESTEHPDLLSPILTNTTIQLDSQGILWIGTSQGEIYTIDPQQPRQTRPLDFVWATDWGEHTQTDHFLPLMLETL